MKAIKEYHLEHLGFVKQVQPAESRADEFYYYTKNLSLEDNGFYLISCANDERIDDNWRIYISDIPEYEIDNYDRLVVLLEALNSNITLKARETNNFNLI